MDINDGRIIQKQIEEYFQGTKRRIIWEFGGSSRDDTADSLRQLCLLEGEEGQVIIMTVLWLESEIIELCMHFNEELPESIVPKFLELINEVNLKSGGCYWTKIQGSPKMEFRTAYMLSGEAFNKSQFKRIVERFMKIGLYEYHNLKSLIAGSETSTN